MKRDLGGRNDRSEEIIAEIYDYLGPFENLCGFDGHSHPITSSLVRIVDIIGWTLVQYYKERFGRLRPSQLDPSIRPMVRVPTFSAYPSGHSTQVHLIARALQEVSPPLGGSAAGRRSASSLHEELDRTARRIAENREWAGVHYSSDTAAGETLARQIWRLIEDNVNFYRLITAARSEWLPDRAIQSGYSFLDHGPLRAAGG